jgi:PIN domain
MIFIDANQYLDLYRTPSGKKLLAALTEQADYIFVTKQISDEVQRNKVGTAAVFLAHQFKQIALNTFAVPDHLFGSTSTKAEEIRQQLKDIGSQFERTNDELRTLACELLDQISRSEDEVSKTLAGIFARAVPHTDAELHRARVRRELGNPPGKKGDPLGDQLTWEQILTRFKETKRIWVITRDSDYTVKYEGKVFLNAALYQELAQLAGPTPDVFCFDNLPEGIRHFAEATKVKAEALPTPEETEQIKKEQESLPPMGWLPMGKNVPMWNSYYSRPAAFYASLSGYSPTVLISGVGPASTSEVDKNK